MASSAPVASRVLDQVVAQRERLATRMERVGRVIAIVSGKGGVGKTALSAHLAAALAARGRRVGALDGDLTGSTLAQMLGARGQALHIADEGLEPAVGIAGVKVMAVDLLLPGDETPADWRRPVGLAEDTFVWRGAMETTAVRELLADTAWGDLDELLIDMPPGTERFATFAHLIPKLQGVVVTIASAASQLVVRRSVATALRGDSSLLGLVENMAGYRCVSCGETGPMFVHEPRGQRFAEELGIPFLGAVPFDPELADACNRGRPLVLTEPGSPTARALESVTTRIIGSAGDIGGPT